MDIELLGFLSVKDNYIRYSPYLKGYVVTPETRKIFKAYKKWFESHNEIHSWKLFRTFFYMSSGVSSSEASLYDPVFEELEANGVPDEADFKAVLLKLMEKDYAAQVQELCVNVLDDRGASLRDVEPLVEKWYTESGQADDDTSKIVTNDIYELIKNTSTGGFEWRLPFFNESIGPLTKEMLVMVAAYTDAGKTTLLASEISHMLTQMGDDDVVLWFNNEQGGSKVMLRVMQSLAYMTKEEYESDTLEFVNRLAKHKAIDKLKVVNDASLNTKRVEKIIRRFGDRVKIIVFDQLWKIHGFSNEGDVQRQTLLAQWARELTKEYAPVITTHQGDATTEWAQWINMSQLYGSKVGVQGECDVIITVGRMNDPTREDKRYIYVPKNKESRGTDPSKRNGRYEATIDTKRGRYA